MSEIHSTASPEDDPTDNQPAQTTTSAQNGCSYPTSTPSTDSSGDAQHAALISADIDAGLSGIQADADVLGHDLADASIGLGLVDAVLDLADSKLGLVDQLLCDVV